MQRRTEPIVRDHATQLVTALRAVRLRPPARPRDLLARVGAPKVAGQLRAVVLRMMAIATRASGRDPVPTPHAPALALAPRDLVVLALRVQALQGPAVAEILLLLVQP